MIPLLLLPLFIASSVQGKCELKKKCARDCHQFAHRVVNSNGDLTLYEYECKKGHLWIKENGADDSSNYIKAIVCNVTTDMWYKVDSRERSSFKPLSIKAKISCDDFPVLWLILPILFIIIILIFVILFCIIVFVPLRRRYLRREASQSKSSKTKRSLWARTPCKGKKNPSSLAVKGEQKVDPPPPPALADPATPLAPATAPDEVNVEKAPSVPVETATPLTPATPVSPFETPTPHDATPVQATPTSIKTPKSRRVKEKSEKSTTKTGE